MARSVLVVTVHLGEKKNAGQGLFLACWESWSVFQCKICDAQYELPAFRYPRIWPPWLSREGQKSAIAKKASVSLQPRKVVHKTSPDSANVRVFQRLNGKDRDTVNKVYEIAFYFVLQGLPFTMFVHQLNLEKLHGVYYIGTYENEAAWYIRLSVQCVFEEKVESVNVISILHDSFKDKSVTEQKVDFVVLSDL